MTGSLFFSLSVTVGKFSTGYMYHCSFPIYMYTGEKNHLMTFMLTHSGISILQAIKYWRWEQPGNEARRVPLYSL